MIFINWFEALFEHFSKNSDAKNNDVFCLSNRISGRIKKKIGQGFEVQLSSVPIPQSVYIPNHDVNQNLAIIIFVHLSGSR